MPTDCFALGQCVVDRLGVVEEFPAPDEKRELIELVEDGGGPAATAAVALARWGRRCAFGGGVGDDREGDLIRAELAAAGVDVARLLVRPGERSQFAFVAIERGTGRRRIYWRRPTGPPPAPDELDPPEARVLLTDGLYAEASLAAARRADVVVVDAGTLREGTRAMLPVADVFVASESFARALVGADDPEGACRRIREAGATVAGVTLGARGYVYSCGDGGAIVARPAHPVAAVDTTGCGDVFHAGLVEGVLAGWSWERTFDFAAWAAAQVATRLGGRAGIPEKGDYDAVSSG